MKKGMKKGMAVTAELQKALGHHQAGNLRAAEKIYRRVLKAQPGNPDALHLSGLVHHRLGRHDKAIGLIRRAVKAVPGNPMFLNNLGEACREAGKLVEAAGHYREALKVDPGHADAWSNLGLVLTDRGKAREAEDALLKAIGIDPRMSGALANLGNLLADQDRPAEARDRFEQALAIDPNQPEVLNSLALALKDLGDLEGAHNCCLRAVKLDPGYAECWINLGHVLLKRQKLPLAEEAYKEAFRLNPDFNEDENLLLALGLTISHQNRPEEAISRFRRVLEINPGDPTATAYLFSQFQKTLNWDEMAELAPRMDRQTRAILEEEEKDPEGAADGYLGETPFINVSRSDDPAINLGVARFWSRKAEREALQQARPFVHKPRDGKKLRERPGEKAPITIGYVSSDFRDHPIGHVVVRLFGLHERKDFRVFAYSNGADDGSIYRKTLESDADKFTDIRGMSDGRAAKLIHDDGIDILIDLNGYTEGGRLSISAHRPAPVQAVWLGFPGTSGASFMDYIITDSVSSPPEIARHFTESPVYLPYYHQPYDHNQDIAEQEVTHAQCGLPDEGVVFCSFNHNYKIEPVMFSAWMRILRSVPGSVLWIMLRGEPAKENLLNEAVKRGIDPERIVFADQKPKAEQHMKRLGLADLVLDTRVYGGHTTTTDALCAGVPVLTLRGGHVASRIPSSLLRAAGLPELVTESLAEYEALAIRLGRNPAEIAEFKRKIAEKRKTEPLFDGPLFVLGLEAAYREMWRTWRAGEKPETIKVAEPRVKIIGSS